MRLFRPCSRLLAVLNILYLVTALPTNHSTSLNINTRTRWGPAAVDNWVFSGSYENVPRVKNPDVVISEFLESFSANILAAKQVALVQPGRIETYYCGINGQSKLTFEWIMVGGALRYSECDLALVALERFLKDHWIVNDHTGTIDVSQNGNTKFRVTVSSEAGFESADIHEGAPLEIAGYYWPHRQLPIAQVRSVLTWAIESIQHVKPDEPVEFSPIDEACGSVGLALGFFEAPFPPVAVVELIWLLRGILNFYQNHGGASLYSGIYTPSSYRPVGWFLLTELPNQLDTGLNQTNSTLANGTTKLNLLSPPPDLNLTKLDYLAGSNFTTSAAPSETPGIVSIFS